AINQNKFILKRLRFLAGIAFGLFSCRAGKKEGSTTISEGDSEQTSRGAKGKSFNCSQDFQEDYSKLLTKEEMASIYPIDFKNAKVDLSSGSYGSHIYSWPSDRPDVEQVISGMKIKGRDFNTMGVALLSFYGGKDD